MALACLAVIEPLNPTTGRRRKVRLASAQDRRITGLGGHVWEPAMLAAPTLSLSLFNGDFSAAASVGDAQFQVDLETVRRGRMDLNPVAWNGAPITIHAAEPGAMWPWPVVFRGNVKEIRRQAQTLNVAAEVDTAAFDRNVLTIAYKGSGDSEGGDDLKNRVKPLVIGWAKNVEPVLIDVNNSVYQFSGYGPIEEVTSLYERAADYGSSYGNFSSYTTLVAAAIPAGKWATCLNEGLIRLGAPAYGVITGDVRGHAVDGVTPRLTGAVIRTLAAIAGVAPERIDRASFDAMDIALPYPINLVLTDQITAIEVAQRLALGCNHQAAVSLLGTLFVTTPDLAQAEALTLDAMGRAMPQVLESSEMPVSVPYWKHTFGAARNWRVQSKDEIAFWADLVERGLYNPATVYREGNIVSMEDGSRFLYINTSPTSGNAPPNATYWGQLSGAIGEASNIVYKKAATKPATPSPSAGVPSTWFDDIANVGAANQPIWACYGAKASGAANYVWQSPYNVSADARLFDGLDTNGAVKTGQVGTGAMVGNAVTAPWYVESSATLNFVYPNTTTVLSTSVVKEQASSLLEVLAQIPLHATDADDAIVGVIWYRLFSGVTEIRSRSFRLKVDGNGTTRIPLAFEQFWSGVAAGTYTVRIEFQATDSSAPAFTNGDTYHLRVREYKR